MFETSTDLPTKAIVLGAPGAGKSTIGRLISAMYSIPFIGPHDIPNYETISDEDLIEWYYKRFKDDDVKKGWVVEASYDLNFSKAYAMAVYSRVIPNKVVLLDVSTDQLERRSSLRQPELSQKVSSFEQNIDDLYPFWQNFMAKINGSQSKEDVFQQTVQFLAVPVDFEKAEKFERDLHETRQQMRAEREGSSGANNSNNHNSTQNSAISEKELEDAKNKIKDLEVTIDLLQSELSKVNLDLQQSQTLKAGLENSEKNQKTLEESLNKEIEKNKNLQTLLKTQKSKSSGGENDQKEVEDLKSKLAEEVKKNQEAQKKLSLHEQELANLREELQDDMESLQTENSALKQEVELQKEEIQDLQEELDELQE